MLADSALTRRTIHAILGNPYSGKLLEEKKVPEVILKQQGSAPPE